MKTLIFRTVILCFTIGFGHTQIYALSQQVETSPQREIPPPTTETRTEVLTEAPTEAETSPQREIEEIDLLVRIKTMEHKRIQDAGIPRFVLTDRKHQFAFGIGGVMRGTAGSEFGGIVNVPMNEGMLPSFIPISYDGLPRSQLRMSASTSQIFMKMVGNIKHIGNIETFVSMDFHGLNYTPRLRQAYLKLGNFTFGQTWSAMADLKAIPPTIDFDGPISMVAVRTPLIRYDGSFYEDKYKFAASLEYPEVNATYSPNTKAVTQAIPNIVALIQRNWGYKDENHLRVSGVLRNMSYYDNINSKTNIEQGWGVQLSSMIDLPSNIKFYGQGIYGYGIAGYMNDPANLNVDLLPRSPSSGIMKPQKTWGFTAGLQYNITKDLFTSVAYSYNRIDKDDNVAPDLEMYKYGQYIVTNLFWNFTDDCTVAIEYLRGSRVTFDNSFGKANRINLLVQYAF